MRRDLTDGDFSGEFWDQLANFQRTAWRWENQPVYEIGPERANIEAFLAGTPHDPMADEYLAPWMHQVAAQTTARKQIGRVRVVEEPPTDYQRWERWLDRWNREAGEAILYLPRSYVRRHLQFMAPFEGTDWWLFDDARVMIMHFDAQGVRTRVELTDNRRDVTAAVEFSRLARIHAKALGDETLPRAA